MQPNLITALATITTALAAILVLLLTSKQIRTSNKQFLFNKKERR